MNSKFWLLAIFVFSSHHTFSQEIKTNQFGKGIFNLIGQDSTWTMKFAARAQFLGAGTWSAGEETETNFLIRRARFKFDGFVVSPKLRYKLELGLSNRDISGASIYTSNSPRYILDAVIKWNFYRNFVLWFGQTKLPGNRERVISSGNMQQVDRSLLNRHFNIDRDFGIQLRHHFYVTDSFLIREIFSIAQGEGRNVTTGNLGGYQYTGRLEFLPFGRFDGIGDYSGADLKRENNPKLSVGISYDFNNNAVKTRSNQGSYMETDKGYFETNITTLFVDAMFKYQGFSLMAEYSDRNADDVFAFNSDGSLTGDFVQIGNAVNLQTGYLFKNNWEVSGRYTNISLDDLISGTSRDQLTLGVSRYIVGHKLKVQSDISLTQEDNTNDLWMFRLQFDIHF